MLKQLNDTINYDEAMKRVSVSELHFKNVFFFLTGMSINQWMGLHEHLKTGVVSYPPRFQGVNNAIVDLANSITQEHRRYFQMKESFRPHFKIRGQEFMQNGL